MGPTGADYQAGSLASGTAERTFLSQRILHLEAICSQRSRRSMNRRIGGEGRGGEETGAHLLHSAQESSPRERFTWTSSGGMDFRTEEPLASEPDRMASGYGGGGRGWVSRDGGIVGVDWDAVLGALYDVMIVVWMVMVFQRWNELGVVCFGRWGDTANHHSVSALPGMETASTENPWDQVGF